MVFSFYNSSILENRIILYPEIPKKTLRMKLFLSYATENYEIAEEVYLALVGAGHEVFFDRPSLKPGENYTQRLREAITNTDGMIFLISPKSIKLGSYALTELKYTRQKWEHPEGRVLPVMVQPHAP